MRRGARLALVAVVPLLALGAALALAVGRDDAEGCEVDEHPEQAGGHLASLPAGFVYNSFPPTSGPSADRPVVWEAYSRPVAQFRLVHNLLHGGVAVQYGSRVPEEDIRAIERWYGADPDGVVVAPLPQLGDRVALTAWRTVATCGGFHERSFTAFRLRHRYNGPEAPPRETMRPGRGGAPNPLGLRVTPSPVRGRATLAFLYADSATVDVVVRRGGASGPVVRRLATISTVPQVPVRLRWDGRDGAGAPLRPGTYAAVARTRAPRPTVSVSMFTVR